MTSSLYRSYLRLLEKWPADASKKGRDLGEHIRLRVAEAFKGSEPADVNKCEEIQAILNRIASNRYKEAFYISKSSSASGLSAEDCQQILSNEFLKIVDEQERGTATSRLKTLWSKKPTETEESKSETTKKNI